MKRRDLLTAGLCSIAGLGLGLGSAKITDKVYDKNKLSQYKSEKWLKNLNIPICYHCNLNCSGCDHFSPLASPYEASVDSLERDIKQMQKITDGNIREIHILGGEPLLHKNIEKIMEIVADYFPCSHKIILTNGILINKMSSSFWKTCSKTNTMLKCSLYADSVYGNYSKSFKYENMDNYNLIFRLHRVHQFLHLGLKTHPTYEINQQYKTCVEHVHCSHIDNGLLSRCEVTSMIKIFNSYFKDNQVPFDESDLLNIYEIDSIDQILDFYEKPNKLCAYCNYGHSADDIFNWHTSEYKVSEWMDS